ncbi:hypothetical protein KI387_018577, partial [Taxus chinensis]
NPIGSDFRVCPSNLSIQQTVEEVTKDLHNVFQAYFDLNPLVQSCLLYLTEKIYIGQIHSASILHGKVLDNSEPNRIRVDSISICNGW